MHSRIQIVGSIVPPTPLPHCRLDSGEDGQMALRVPGARGEPRPLRPGPTYLDRRDQLVSRRVFRTRSPVHECAKVVSVRGGRLSGVPATFALEVTRVRNLFDHHRFKWSQPCANLGHYGAATELGRSVITEFCYPCGHECIASHWDGPKGEIWWEVGTSQCLLGSHQHIVGDPNWIAIFQGGD